MARALLTVYARFYDKTDVAALKRVAGEEGVNAWAKRTLLAIARPPLTPERVREAGRTIGLDDAQLAALMEQLTGA